VIYLLSFWTLLLALPGQEPSPQATEHVQAGISAENAGQHDAAIAEFRKASELDPNFAAAYVDLGAVYMGEGKYEEATATLKRAVLLDPTILPAQDMLGDALLYQGYAAEAIPHFLAANDKGAMGSAQLETGDLSAAVANLQAGLAEHPNDPGLLFSLARASGLLSRQAKDALISAHPDSAQAHAAMAQDYWSLKQAGDAEAEYRKALAISPNLPGTHLGLGLVYEDTRQWDKAEAEFQAEAKLAPGSAEAAYRLGNTLLENGKTRTALVELKRANSLQPGMPETLYALGKAEAAEGDLHAAESAWTQLLSVEKDSDLARQAHFSLAGLYRKLGRAADASREMKAFEAMKAAGK